MCSRVVFIICAVFVCSSSVLCDQNLAERKARETADQDLSDAPLHSYMKQLYSTRARGNGNGSLTVNVRNRTILATTIRGYEPRKNETTWKASLIEMQFGLGKVLHEEEVIEAELIVTSKYGSKWMGHFNASLYTDRTVFPPKDSELLDSRALPHRPHVEFSLDVTRAFHAWNSSSLNQTIKLLLKVEDWTGSRHIEPVRLSVQRCFKHGFKHGPFLVLYTQSKHGYNKDDKWKLVKLTPPRPVSTPENFSASDPAKLMDDEGEFERNTSRVPRHPFLTCHRILIRIKMKDYYKNVLLPKTGWINYCLGYCLFPIQNHLTPTTHAVILARWWQINNPGSYPPAKPMCVPANLTAQTVLLFDSDTSQAVQQEWEDFSVKTCGCR